MALIIPACTVYTHTFRVSGILLPVDFVSEGLFAVHVMRFFGMLFAA